MSSRSVTRHKRIGQVGAARVARPLAVALALGLALGARPAAAQQEGGVVAGVVIDAGTLRPLDNVQVAVDGTALSALTDGAGRFRIATVPGAQVRLQLRRLGYRPGTESVRVGQTTLRISMVSAPAMLNEVVISGTAEPVEKRALGNSVTKIQAADVQQVAPSPGATSRSCMWMASASRATCRRAPRPRRSVPASSPASTTSTLTTSRTSRS
jgi:hypothetical protein